MKRLKKWALVLAVTGPAVTTPACSSTLVRSLRDAAVNGAASYVEGVTFDLLDQFVVLGGGAAAQ